jgi:hypothetical protein
MPLIQEMEFHLRERNTTTLEEMQNSAIGVEANLLIKKSKLKAEERKNIKKKHLTSSEVKLDILVSTMKEMMQNIIMRDDLVVQKHHVPLVVEEEKVTDPNHFVVNSCYNRTKNDCFTDVLMGMLDDSSYMDDLPKYDQYDDDYIKVDSSKQSTTYFWEEEAQLQQLKYDNQPVHINYDNNEENARNFQVSERSLPLCFSSFQSLREIYKQADQQVVNSRNGEFSDELIVEVFRDMEVVLAPKLQPLSYLEFQIPDESLEPETDYELMKNNYVPLSFNSFQFLKKNLDHVLNDKHIENYEVSLEPMQQSSQFLQDPIADVLDDMCSQSLVPLASYEIKRSYDIDLIRQLTSWSCSTGVSLQSSSENLQPYQELYIDIKSICAIPNYDPHYYTFNLFCMIFYIYSSDSNH